MQVLDGNINALKYINIIDNNMWPVIARHFPDETIPSWMTMPLLEPML